MGQFEQFTRVEVDFVRDPLFESRCNFNPEMDYIGICEKLDAFARAKDKNNYQRLVEETGTTPTMLSSLAAYQQGIKTGKTYILQPPKNSVWKSVE